MAGQCPGRERGRERVERELCLLKKIAEGTYKTKHAEAARLDYTTTQRHIDTNMNKYTPASTPKLGHAREIHCAPSHLGQHGVARHEAHPHVGARRKGRHGSQQPEHTQSQWSNDAGGSRHRGGDYSLLFYSV